MDEMYFQHFCTFALLRFSMLVFLQFFLKDLICVVVLAGTKGRRSNFYCHIFSCFKFCIFELLCFDLCGGVGGHNVQFVLSAFLQFCTFAFSAFFLGKF